MRFLYLVTGMALVTFSIRYLLLPLSGRVRFSDGMQRALRYVPPSVLTAIIVPATFMPDGQTIDPSWTNPYVIGAAATILIGWFSKNLLITIVGGMAVFAVWQWVLTLI